MRRREMRNLRPRLLVIFPAIGYLGLHVLGFWYPRLLWGTDQFSYYPPVLLLAFIATCIASTAAALHSGLMVSVESAVGDILKKLPAPSRLAWPALLVCGATAWIFRVGSHHLGDSQMWFGKVAAFASGNVTAFPFMEALDFLIHLEVFRLGYAFFGWQPVDAYALISIASCPVYVTLLWKISHELTSDRLRRITWFAVLITAGTLQFYFGYGESYTLVHLAAAAYALFALRFLAGKCHVAVPAGLLLLAMLLHLMSMCLIPSLAVLLYGDARLGSYLRNPKIKWLLVCIGGAASAALYAGLYQHHHLPFWTSPQPGRFPIISWDHALNLVNEVLLLSPFGLVWAAASGRRSLVEPARRFLLAALLGGAALVAVHNIVMGGRDWDLMSFPSIFGLLLGIAVIEGSASPSIHSRLVRWAILPAMIWHTTLWIGINHDPGRGLERLGNLLYHTPNQPLHYRAFVRGHYYLNLRDDPAEAARHFREALELVRPDPTYDFLSHYRRFLDGATARARDRASSD